MKGMDTKDVLMETEKEADDMDPRVMIGFFSSRRRHTRYWRDWSSDVCSSDLWCGPGRWSRCSRSRVRWSREAPFAARRAPRAGAIPTIARSPRCVTEHSVVTYFW